MSKTYSIVRVSSVSQSDNTSLQHQKDTIGKYCDLYELELNQIIEEIYTGTTSDRDGLNFLMDKVLSGDCDTIIVYKIDRLFRSFSEGVVYIQKLIDNGCRIISTQEKQIDTSTPSGSLFMNLLLSMSQFEKQTISERLLKGKEHRFQKDGRIVCGKIPFGYKKVNDDIVLDEQNSKIVKLIFRLFNSYRTLSKSERTRKILKSLHKRGYTFNGKKFTRHQLHYLTQNKFYKGIISWCGESRKHIYPTLVSPRLFNIVNPL